jgi:hypothetical protein
MSIQVGESIRLAWAWVDELGAPVDPDTQDWDIYDANGIVVKSFTEADLIYVAPGSYKVYYDLDADAPIGVWRFVPRGTKTGRTGKGKPVKFSVQAASG